MKKLLGLTLSLASIGFVVSSAEAKAATSSATSTIAVESSAAAQGRNRRNNRRVRVITRTRLVRVGRRVYRETYQIRYLPNGRTTTRLISRVRVR